MLFLPRTISKQQVLSKSVFVVSFFQQSDSNLGRLGVKRKRYHCAMLSPLLVQHTTGYFGTNKRLVHDWIINIFQISFLDCSFENNQGGKNIFQSLTRLRHYHNSNLFSSFLKKTPNHSSLGQCFSSNSFLKFLLLTERKKIEKFFREPNFFPNQILF